MRVLSPTFLGFPSVGFLGNKVPITPDIVLIMWVILMYHWALLGIWASLLQFEDKCMHREKYQMAS